MPNLYDQATPAPAPEPLPTPARALTIGAHPDDAEFGAGGTLAKWAAAGCHVTMLVVTDGSKGTWDPDLDPELLVISRRAEQRAAADALGAADIVMLDHVDGELEHDMDLRRELCGWIRELRPDVVLGHDPWKRYMLHPDHRAAGMGLIDGVVAARDHLFHPDLGPKHRPDAILLWSADEPDHAEPIDGTLDTKIEALLHHSTQGETTMGDAHVDAEARDRFATRIRDWAYEQGESFGIGPAELFKLIRP
jgi:LmbE family N-acetylglucosaminyl deacetylase